MLRESFDIQVPPKETMKKGLVFGFRARLPIAKILSFTGHRHEVLEMMQLVSNGTRAYIWNSDGDKGFVKRLDIMEVLKQAQ